MCAAYERGGRNAVRLFVLQGKSDPLQRGQFIANFQKLRRSCCIHQSAEALGQLDRLGGFRRVTVRSDALGELRRNRRAADKDRETVAEVSSPSNL